MTRIEEGEEIMDAIERLRDDSSTHGEHIRQKKTEVARVTSRTCQRAKVGEG